MPTSPDAVKRWLRLSDTDTTDDQLLVDVCAAVNTWVARLPWVAAVQVWPDPLPSLPTWPPDVDQGTTMLAARMYRRRNTPGGVEAFTDAVVYVPRRDSDVDQLLRIGSYGMPRVG